MKLFQYITLFFCCGIFMCSCTDDVKGIPDENPDTPLLFSCSVASARGSQTTTETLLSMGVVGFETGALDYTDWKKQLGNSIPNFMTNQLMKKEDGTWTYSPVKYWPKEGIVSFFAYAPYGSIENGVSINGTTLTYATPSNADNHPDLLIAAPILNPNAGSTLQFSFSHVLACVSFKYTGAKALTGITLTGIKTKGTIELDTTTPSWSFNAEATDITCKWITDSETDHYLMLLPQTPAAEAKATLSFGDSTQKECYLTLANGWVAGSRYQYTITD